MKNHFQCFSQHRRDIAIYRRPSKGRSALSLNDFEAHTFRQSSRPQFYKGGKLVTC